MTTAWEVAFGPRCVGVIAQYNLTRWDLRTGEVTEAWSQPGGRWEFPKPEPCGPPSDPNRSHIYRAPRWVPNG